MCSGPTHYWYNIVLKDEKNYDKLKRLVQNGTVWSHKKPKFNKKALIITIRSRGLVRDGLWEAEQIKVASIHLDRSLDKDGKKIAGA